MNALKTPPVIELQGVHKTYRLGAHTVPALRGVDLAVRPGELVALTGPSGSGKSTILNIAGLIDRADAGTVRLRGQTVDAGDEAAATAVGLREHAGHRPDALSGGQRQRVAIARALIKRPGLVIADEPTASLDSSTATQMLDLMRELGHRDGAAFLIATHDERLTRRCDRVIALRDGVIATTDTEMPA